MTTPIGPSARHLTTIAAALALFAFSGCKPTAPAAPADTIAEVGGLALTAGDLNREFALAGIPQDKRGEEETRMILGNLVTRKYLASKALAARLDSDPQVAGDIARTREQLLSAAFSQVEAKDKTLAISDADVNAYVADHPRAFAKHVVYFVDQVATPLQGDVAAYAAMTEDAKTLEAVETKLDALKVPRSRSRSELDGAAITQGLADALAGQTPDAVFFARRDNLGVFFKVLSVEPRPVTGRCGQDAGLHLAALRTARQDRSERRRGRAASDEILGGLRQADGGREIGALDHPPTH